MRAFIAVELPGSIRKKLGELNDHLRTAPVRASWVRPDRMHLTLRFLGDVQEDVLPALDGVLEPACHDVAPFNLNVEGLGAFPNWRRPNVIWAGAGPLEPSLRLLQDAAEQAAQAAGLPAETKPFHPHITLARIKEPRKASALAGHAESWIEFNAGGFAVSHVSLFSSELTSRGPIYTCVREYALNDCNFSR